ncbi:MAG: ABC transporter ATP-binding protein [Ignavibacteria bacterium]|nr:ABC transporter ATP-binding protein [Ignavibacteria bacterium]
MVHVEHLVKTYGTFTAVNDISLNVQQGEVFAMLGPNGSGKTSTMKCIVGLNVPTSGRIRIDGKDILKFPIEARRLMSYLPQRVIFPENLTAREVIRFFGRMRHLPPGRADEMLLHAQFNGFSDKPVGDFSGGMIQRLGLAVVTLPDTPILLLDEPTANLDPQGVKRFREFILQQKEKGKTIIFSTHLLAEAEQLADQVGIFVGGKLVACESVEGLRSARQSASTVEDLYIRYVGAHEDEHA